MSKARWCGSIFAAVLIVGAPALARAPSPLSFTATTLSQGGGEPNVSISPSGRTVLVDGLNASPATLFRSTDAGHTFTRIRPAFAHTGGGDWDMRFLDEHTVIAADLSITQGIYIHRSTDSGSTWTTAQIHMDVYDRPWLDHFGLNAVFVVAKGFDGIPYLYRSSDGGRTFGNPPIPILVYGTGVVPAAAGGTSPTPVEAFVTNQDAYVDHLTVDQRTGDVYVLYGIGGENSYSASKPTGVANRLYVAHLENGAMVSHPVHIGGATESSISGFNWMTVDRAGTLYVLADGSIGGHHSARLSYSKDKGKTWSSLVDLGSRGAANVYGSIAGGDAGVLSLVYLRGSNENPSTSQNWYAEMARVTKADSHHPAIERVRPIRAAIHTADICFDGILCGAPGFGNNRDLLDYIWNAIDHDGNAYAVVASDGPATGGGGVSVLVLRQSGGARHGRGVQS